LYLCANVYDILSPELPVQHTGNLHISDFQNTEFCSPSWREMFGHIGTQHKKKDYGINKKDILVSGRAYILNMYFYVNKT
jgi:hypothetical protein